MDKLFVFYTDHEALKFINSNYKLSSKHVTWVEFCKLIAL